ncbi:sphingomyelin phosphodiesterase A-like [Halichondria panicea]|uniref:sphingomyelin phosphodiesterase A-like n=1 Tax=Halichondria panicea TaxID=6063 RepID=UPI00312B3F3D
MQYGPVTVLLVLFGSFLPFSSALPVFGEEHADNISAIQDDGLCALCLDAAELFQQAVESNLTLDTIYPIIHGICVEVIPRGGEYTCPGFIYSYGPVVLYVMSNILIDPRIICQEFKYCKKFTEASIDESLVHLKPHIRDVFNELKRTINVSKAHDYDASQRKQYTFDLDQLKSKPVQVPQMINTNRTAQMKKKISGENGVLRFLQLADLHLDQQYGEGSPYDCGLYLCCRHWYNGTGKAGHYGEFKCDLPMPTLDLLAETLQKLDPQPDFVIYTGDNAPHDVWNETWTTQLDATQFVVDYLAEKLPSMTIYPAIGNHESWPESEYLGTMLEFQALNRDLAYKWQKWADFPQDALDTIVEGGYYNIRIMDNLRLISFNSDYGYTPNFYSFLNAENDHYKNQLIWIKKQLSLAEKQGDKVLLIAHIPPGDPSSHAEYGEFYLSIAKQFSDTVVGHLFGHTHTDQFELVQDADGVYGAVLIAPSVTTYGHINPSFRIFTMDTNTKTLLGYEQYHLNVTHANELYSKDPNSKPKFELSYTTKDEYGLKDLSPVQWASLVSRFETEPSLLSKYNLNIHAKTYPADKNCDSSCKKHILCSVTNAISSHYEACVAEE